MKDLALAKLQKNQKDLNTQFTEKIRRNTFNSQYLSEKVIKLTKKENFINFSLDLENMKNLQVYFCKNLKKNIMA